MDKSAINCNNERADKLAEKKAAPRITARDSQKLIIN